MIQKLLLNTQMIWTIFLKILKNTTQVKNKKIFIVLDDTIADTLNNKESNPVVTELFNRERN